MQRRGLPEPVVGQLAVDGEAAHDRDRDAAELALDQIGGGGDLVGDRDLGDLAGRCRARRSRRDGRTARSTPATPIAASVMPVAPGPAHGVADDDADLDAAALPQGLAQPLRRRVRVDRQQREFVARDVRRVDAGGGEHKPVPRLRRSQVAAAGDTRTVSASIGRRRAASRCSGSSACRARPAGPRSSRSTLDVTTSDVAVLRAAVLLGDQRGQIVAGPQLADAEHRQDLEPRCRVIAGGHATSSSAARTIAAVASSSVISSGTARTSTPGHLGGVAVVDQPAVEHAAGAAGAVVAADALGADLDADRGQARRRPCRAPARRR